MIRSAPALALLTCTLIALTAMGARGESVNRPLAISAQALDTGPESRIEGDRTMDDAVAAAVIGALSKQFGEQRLAVKLDKVAVAPASLLDRSVSGDGRLQIGGDVQWIPFHFSALYDTVKTSVSYPQLKIGGSTAGKPIPGTSRIAVSLSDKVDAALRSEFPQQPVEMVMERVTTAAVGERYLQVTGVGTADFGAEGTTVAHVEALYDRSNGSWIRVDYELGATADWSESPATPVAAR